MHKPFKSGSCKNPFLHFGNLLFLMNVFYSNVIAGRHVTFCEKLMLL